MIGYAIGNGLSRLGMEIPTDGPIVACNRAYTDTPADYIVALDWPVILEIEKLDHRDFQFITRTPRWSHFTLDGEPICKIYELNGKHAKNSGIVACAFLAKILQCSTIYMIGFDFFAYDEGDKTNDIYGGLHRHGNIITPFNTLFARYPETEFIRVGPWRDEYSTLKGLTFEDRLRDR
jgi:hypothetical protein